MKLNNCTAFSGLIWLPFSSNPERYVFTVSPKRDTPIFLATPGWPLGMSDYSTISWIVSVPEKMEAHLVFVNVSQPKCNTHHTGIKVQRIGSVEEKYSRREDEEPESEIVIYNSFYLNMSSCIPERGQFSVITKITLQNCKSKKIPYRAVRVLYCKTNTFSQLIICGYYIFICSTQPKCLSLL